MKYLKAYKLFESNDLYSDVEDILLELKDRGYKVDVSPKPQGVDVLYVEVSNDNLFQWSDVEEYFSRAKNWISQNGFKLTKIDLYFYGSVVRIKEFITFSGSNWNYFIHYITEPEFIQNNRISEISLVFEPLGMKSSSNKTFESVSKFPDQFDVEDIFLELEDRGSY